MINDLKKDEYELYSGIFGYASYPMKKTYKGRPFWLHMGTIRFRTKMFEICYQL